MDGLGDYGDEVTVDTAGAIQVLGRLDFLPYPVGWS
tara:strand:- start:133 stop:240 length:108 start_codon:yes stop_codon:yes gene_type:complete